VAPDRASAAPPESALAFLLRYALPGFVGSALLTVGALGVGWLPLNTTLLDNPAVEVFRGSTAGTLVSRGMIFAGVALLLQAWLVLGYDLLSGQRLGVSRVTTVLIAWCLPLMVSPPLFSRDVFSYYAQGKLMEQGFDPYSSGVAVIPGWFQDGVDPMWSEAPTPYGPLFLLIERGVANFALAQPLLAALVFRVVAVVGVALLAVYVPRLAFLHGINGATALWVGVLNPLVLMHFVAGGHNDALMAGLMVAGLCLAAEGKGMFGSAAIALAASVKPIALLALPFAGLLWAGSRADWPTRILGWLKATAVASGTFVATMLVAGVGLGWLGALGTPGEVRTWLSPSTALGLSVGGVSTWLGVTDSNDLAVTVFRAIGTLAGVAVVAWLCLRPEGRSPVRGAALAFLAVVVLGPVVQPWYLLWFLPLFAATGLTPRELRWTIILTALFAIHGMAESSATSDNLLELTDGLAILTAAVIVGVVLLASPRERQLVLGDPVSHGLLPADRPAQARADRLVFRGAGAPA
jgi:alpha-1,6-mannosyltransferase